MRFTSYDGTVLAYRELGSGPPLICVPGGPGRASEYLGDLGGLGAHHRLLVLDNRGTGDSAESSDPSSYHAVRLVEDVEALRRHLGLERIDVLAHSAAGNIVALYAARYGQRLGRLVLVTPGWRAVDLAFGDDEWFAAMQQRADEPWYPAALAAVKRVNDGDRSPETRLAAAPLFYGRWTEETREHAEREEGQRNQQAIDNFRAGSFGDPAQTRAALANVDAEVLVLGGELDPAPTPRVVGEFAALFPRGRAVIQAGGGHFPWLDDPASFVTAITTFLARSTVGQRGM